MRLKKKKGTSFLELFLLIKGPGRAHMGPYGSIWARKIPNNT